MGSGCQVRFLPFVRGGQGGVEATVQFSTSPPPHPALSHQGRGFYKRMFVSIVYAGWNLYTKK